MANELITYEGFLNAMIECLQHIDDTDTIKSIMKDYTDQLNRFYVDFASKHGGKIKQETLDNAYELHLQVITEYIAMIKRHKQVLDVMPKIMRAMKIASTIIAERSSGMQLVAQTEVAEKMALDDAFKNENAEYIDSLAGFVLAPILKLEQKHRMLSAKNIIKKAFTQKLPSD